MKKPGINRRFLQKEHDLPLLKSSTCSHIFRQVIRSTILDRIHPNLFSMVPTFYPAFIFTMHLHGQIFFSRKNSTYSRRTFMQKTTIWYLCNRKMCNEKIGLNLSQIDSTFQTHMKLNLLESP